MDVDLIERMIAVFATLPARFLVNVGGLRDTYRAVPDNVYLDAWFPQPSVVAQVRPVHPSRRQQQLLRGAHFGVPSLVMPYCWDGHDNAQRAGETGVGLRLDRADWTPAELSSAIASLLGDRPMRERLAANAAKMAAAPGTARAADAVLALVVTIPRPKAARRVRIRGRTSLDAAHRASVACRNCARIEALTDWRQA